MGAVPGWYADPARPGFERRWSGDEWGDEWRPDGSTPPQPSSTRYDPRMDAEAAPSLQPATRRGGGCGWALLGCGALILVGIIVGSVTAQTNAGGGNAVDAIEKTRAVLSAKYGESYSYSEVQDVTDAALEGMGEEVNDDMRGRAWSAVLSVIDKNPELADVSPMDVMRCAAADDGGSAAKAGMKLPDIIAVCAVELK